MIDCFIVHWSKKMTYHLNTKSAQHIKIPCLGKRCTTIFTIFTESAVASVRYCEKCKIKSKLKNDPVIYINADIDLLFARASRRKTS